MKISKINNNTCCNNNITTMEKHVTIENKELIKADIGEKSKYNTNECNKTNKENQIVISKKKYKKKDQKVLYSDLKIDQKYNAVEN